MHRYDKSRQCRERLAKPTQEENVRVARAAGPHRHSPKRCRSLASMVHEYPRAFPAGATRFLCGRGPRVPISFDKRLSVPKPHQRYSILPTSNGMPSSAHTTTEYPLDQYAGFGRIQRTTGRRAQAIFVRAPDEHQTKIPEHTIPSPPPMRRRAVTIRPPRLVNQLAHIHTRIENSEG